MTYLALLLWLARVTDAPVRHYDLPMLVTHVSILTAAVGGLLSGTAAVVVAVKGLRESRRGVAASDRNHAAIIVVQGLVNGERTALIERVAARDAELALARAELAALKDN